jgi:4-hydroxy-tetrahydrodipicolinate reductase
LRSAERLEFIHRANRDTFARGALPATKWLAKKKRGLYNMDDVLGLKLLVLRAGVTKNA